jgi:hypothetical protein
LLDRVSPIDEGGDDMESGAVGALPEREVVADDPEAVNLLAGLNAETTAFLEMMEANVALLAQRPFSQSAAAALLQTLDSAYDYIAETVSYMKRAAS